MAVVAAFGTSPDASQIAGQQTRLVEHLAVPDSSPVTDIQSLYVHEDQIRPGDTASSLFTRLGLNTEETLQQLRDLPESSEERRVVKECRSRW